MRLISGGLILAGVFFFPWWLNLGLATLWVLIFPRFFELLLPAFLYDLLYPADPGLVPFPAVIAALLLLFLGEIMRKQLRNEFLPRAN